MRIAVDLNMKQVACIGQIYLKSSTHGKYIHMKFSKKEKKILFCAFS